MPVSDANPFFQEFEATFESHSVGMRIRKTHDVPVVHELVKTPSGEESPAALAGVPPAAVLVAVAGEHTLRLRYEECIGRISGRGRPITLAFRQLHAAIDGRGQARRYWQGYLRLKTGDSVWTGLFYVLREDGSLASFPSKDIEGQTPVKVMRVGSDCTLIHGESLKQFLGGDTACFALLAPDGLQLFRAPSPAARLDWVAAFAVFATAHELGLCKASPLPPSASPQQSSTTSLADAGAHPGADRTAALAAPTAAGSRRVAAAGVRRAGGERTTPRTVMQGFLRKRAAPKLWGASEGWEYRWVVLRDDGRLLWYLSPPADRWEVPNGHLCLHGGARVSCSEGALMRHNLRGDEVRGFSVAPVTPKCFSRFSTSLTRASSAFRTSFGLLSSDPFGRGVLRQTLRMSRGWLTVSSAHQPRSRQNRLGRTFRFRLSPQHDRELFFLFSPSRTNTRRSHLRGRPTSFFLFCNLGSELRLRAEARRQKGLHGLSGAPEEVLTHPHEAFALLIGGNGGNGVTRAEFCESAARHLLPMCDVYTAGAVFDALCPKRTGVPDNPGPGSSSAEGLEELLDLVGEGAEVGGLDGVRTGRVHAEALTGSGIGERLTFDVFRRYADALSRAFHQSDAHPSWDDLRIRLGLHPLEALIMGEEFVAEVPRTSSQLDLMALAGWSGNLFLTDRHLFLHFPKRQQVRVIPLGSIQGVRGSSSRAGPFTVDDAIEIFGCEVHTVPLGLIRDEAAGKEAAAAAAAAAASAASAAAAAEAATTTTAQPPTTAPTGSSTTSGTPRKSHAKNEGTRSPPRSDGPNGGGELSLSGSREGHGDVGSVQQRRGRENHRISTSSGGGGGFGGDGNGGFGGGCSVERVSHGNGEETA
ncbi:unnamed protein product, partial [Scytosiphon promiscuus]